MKNMDRTQKLCLAAVLCAVAVAGSLLSFPIAGSLTGFLSRRNTASHRCAYRPEALPSCPPKLNWDMQAPTSFPKKLGQKTELQKASAAIASNSGPRAFGLLFMRK